MSLTLTRQAPTASPGVVIMRRWSLPADYLVGWAPPVLYDEHSIELLYGGQTSRLKNSRLVPPEACGSVMDD